MKQLLPHTPLPPDVIAAIETINSANVFNAEAFAVLDRERRKRGITFVAIMIPLFFVYVGLIWAADALLTTIALPTFVYMFGAFLLAVITHSALLRDRMKDDMRLGEAIARWEEKGGRLRDTPLERRT